MPPDRAGGALEFHVLGPVEVWSDGRPLRLGGERQRALLALLLLRANEVVPSDRLIEALFGPDAPESAANALQVAVSRLRRVLGDDLLQTRPRGYVLRFDPDRLDLGRFERLSSEGRKVRAAGDPATAAATLREALGLWRGVPLADLSQLEFAQTETQRLEEMRLATLLERIDADLELGLGAELVSELEGLVAANPLQERLRGQLMLALYRAGRQADALVLFRQTRALLSDELGLEPGRALQDLERAILQQNPSLDRVRTGVVRETGVLVCPFKGLASFVAADVEYYFGRERLVADLVARLASSPFVGVVGASGSGKSSLVQAGLLPALAAGALPGSEGWESTVVRPGAHPLAEIPELGGGAPFVLAVDQLEEVFTACEDEAERAAFLERLTGVARDPSRRAIVVVALRSDFYGACAVYPAFATLLSSNHLLVGPMERVELGRAIALPAERAGLEVEPDLVEALVGDVAGEPGALPLLSTSLLELWRLRDGRRLRLATYRQAGGVQGAVARLAESAYGQLSEVEQSAARTLLLRLASVSEGAVVRRRVPLEEFDLTADETAAHAVAQLTDARLLTVSEGTIEVSHEALLSEWPRLRAWLDEDREGRRLRMHLAASAREWADRGKDSADLYRGARLAATVDWTADRGSELNQLERDFVAASQVERERELAVRRQQVRRLRGLLVGVGVLLLLAIIAGSFALVTRARAQRSATAAVAERLGAQALATKDLDLSLLLARQGVSLDDSPATRGNLEAALVHSPAALRVTHPMPGRLLYVGASPNGRYLSVVNNGGATAILDAATLRPIRTIRNEQASEFAGNGELLAYSLDEPRFDLVDPATGAVRAAARRPAGAQHWAISPLLDYMGSWAPGTAGGVLTEWSYPGLKPLHRSLLDRGWPVVDLESGSRRLLVFRTQSPDMSRGPGKVEVWSLEPWRRLAVVNASNGASLTWGLDRAGERLVLGHNDGSVTVTNLRTGISRSLHGRHNGAVGGVGFSPDGRTIVSVGDDEQVLVWDAGTGQLREVFTGHAGRVFGPAFATDGSTAYTVGLDGALIAWDLRGGERLGRPFRAGSGDAPSQPFPFERFAFSPDGRRVAAAEATGRVSVVDLGTGKQLLETSSALPGPVHDVAWSPDGHLLATTGVSGRVQAWNPATGALVRTYPHTGDPDSAVAFSRDGRLLAAGGTDGRVLVWDVATGRTVRLLTAPTDVLHIAFSPNDKTLAAALLDVPGTEGGAAYVWRLADGRKLFDVNIDGNYGNGFAVAFSPDGRLVTTGGGDGTVKFYDASTGKPTGSSLIGNPGWVRSVDFDPTGQLLVTAGTDGLTRLWDVKTRSEYGAPLPGYNGVENEAFFSPDGSHVVTVYADGRAIDWDIRPGSWERKACAVAGRNLTHAEWNRYLPGRSYSRTCPGLPLGG